MLIYVKRLQKINFLPPANEPGSSLEQPSCVESVVLKRQNGKGQKCLMDGAWMAD
jgi:hypothetical protein